MLVWTPRKWQVGRMDPLYITLAAVAVSVLAVLLWRIVGRRRPPRPRLPYTKRPSLLTPAEQRFDRLLK